MLETPSFAAAALAALTAALATWDCDDGDAAAHAAALATSEPAALATSEPAALAAALGALTAASDAAASITASSLAPEAPLAPTAVIDERGSQVLDSMRTCRPLPNLLWHSGCLLQAGRSRGWSRLRLRPVWLLRLLLLHSASSTSAPLATAASRTPAVAAATTAPAVSATVAASAVSAALTAPTLPRLPMLERLCRITRIRRGRHL